MDRMRAGVSSCPSCHSVPTTAVASPSVGTRDAPGALHREIPQPEKFMKIGIIGAGHIGGALTRRLTKLGHDVSVAN